MKKATKKNKLVVVLAFALAMVVLMASCSCSNAASSSGSSGDSSSAQASSEMSKVTLQQSLSSAVASASSGASTQKEPFYVLVVGDDTRNGTVSEGSGGHGADGTSRSDTMMLVRVDSTNHQLSLVTVPRDTAAWVDGSKEKINEAYCRYGIEGALDEVERLTGVRAKYYMVSTFVGFDTMVDQLGGLFVYVPAPIQLGDGVRGGTVYVDPGEQVLNGAQALAFARNRKSYGDYQDARRQAQDRKLVISGIQKVLSDSGNAEAYVSTLLANVDTDWPEDELRAFVGDFCAHAGDVRFVSGTGPHEGYEDPEAGGLWLVPRDEETWRRVIEVVNAGGDPNDVVWVPEI